MVVSSLRAEMYYMTSRLTCHGVFHVTSYGEFQELGVENLDVRLRAEPQVPDVIDDTRTSGVMSI